MNWIPRNKKTNVIYPAIGDAEKQRMEKDPLTAGKYTYQAVPEDAKASKPAPPPAEAKTVDAK